MAKVAPDYSFVRDGKSIGEWLRRLVGEDAPQRQVAAEKLQAMQYGVPNSHTELQNCDPIPDMAAQAERFKQAVRDAVETPGFDTAEFVSRLCARRVANNRDWLRRCEEARKMREPAEAQYERIAERLVKRMNAAGISSEAREAATRRVTRAILASCEHDQRNWERATAGAEAMTMASFMAYAVFVALDRAFLAAPESLLFVLDHSNHPHDALAAIQRIGPPAIAFAPLLIERMDHLAEKGEAEEIHRGYDAAAGLGSVGRDNAGVVEAMIQRLRSPHESIRAAAADTLSHLGTNVAGRQAEILPRLHELFDKRTGELWAFVGAVASVGRHEPASRRRIVDLARARPPRLSEPGYKGYRHDLTMGERGVAIDAMRYLTDYPDECIPVLIDAIDTFEEYDPDECYDGPLGRISEAIGRFGPRAAGDVAVALARHLGDGEDELPRAILSAMEAIGPAAAPALPMIEAFRLKHAGEEPLPDRGTTDPRKDDDPVGWVIHRIRGASVT
jgi:hypothetical protein